MQKYLRLLLITVGVLMATFSLAAGPESPSEEDGYPSLLKSIQFQEPIDFCGESVPLENQEIRERLEKEMLLTLADRPQVILWLKRSRRFMPLIEKELAANGLPEDLKYVAIAESALRPHAGSTAGAIGFWQFMQTTGRKYGLSVNAAIDERRSIYKSTQAAIAYFKFLYEEFHSWTLAAAAYNMGEEGLRSEMLLQEVNDYYRLYLPLETQRYIPRIISAKLILLNPEKYGFKLNEDDYYRPFEFDEIIVRCDQRTPIRLVAQAAGTYFKQIKDLNPDIRGHYLPAGSHAILLPKGTGDGFKERFDKAVAGWQKNPDKHVYTVKAGDNLSSIAERFQVPLRALLVWNDLKTSHHIHPGDRLIIYKMVEAPEETNHD
ncbi:MAG: transglycosylase SLT domain-containing protein [Desulfobacterales bacterium]|nr:transglycosylase SLT domain-containing protein [Desulfobacterales bacterium]